MTVKSLLKTCGSPLVAIVDTNEETSFELLAIIDYTLIGQFGRYYSTRHDVPNEILGRKVDFFTHSKCNDHSGKYSACVRIYTK